MSIAKGYLRFLSFRDHHPGLEDSISKGSLPSLTRTAKSHEEEGKVRLRGGGAMLGEGVGGERAVEGGWPSTGSQSLQGRMGGWHLHG